MIHDIKKWINHSIAFYIYKNRKEEKIKEKLQKYTHWNIKESSDHL